MTVTIAVCSVLPAVKGCLGGWVGEENTSTYWTSHAAASNGVASPAKDKTNVSGLSPLQIATASKIQFQEAHVLLPVGQTMLLTF